MSVEKSRPTWVHLMHPSVARMEGSAKTWKVTVIKTRSVRDPSFVA